MPKVGVEPVPEIMDIRQCAEYLQLSPDTLYKYAMDKKVPAMKFGNRWRFKKTLIDAWVVRECEKADMQYPEAE